MSYVVLARKWRPTQFDEVIGQGHVARTLKNAIEQDRVHHAFLFCGARGVGKTSTARILAKALNCRNFDEPTTQPCGECESCTQIAAGQSIDVFEIDGASNRGINEIRELRESVRYAPSRDRYKVYIIDEVHMLTTEAFNALLKTLEEPPPHAKFIFATTEPQKIPVTILSRCQRYDFKRIGQTDIVNHLQLLADEEEMQVEKGALQVLARQAAGGMRDAVSLLDQVVSFAEGEVTEEGVVEVLGVANRRHLFELSEALIDRDTEKALLVLDEVNRYGYDLGQFSSEFLSHIRDLMVVKVVENPDRVTEMTGTELASASEQVQNVDQNLLHRMFSVTTKAAQEMSRSAFPKLVFEMALVRIAQLEPMAGLDVMIDRLVELETAFDGDERLPVMPAEKKTPEQPVAKRTSAGESDVESAKSPVTENSATEAPVADSTSAEPMSAEVPADDGVPAELASSVAVSDRTSKDDPDSNTLTSNESTREPEPEPELEPEPEPASADKSDTEDPASEPVSEPAPESVPEPESREEVPPTESGQEDEKTTRPTLDLDALDEVPEPIKPDPDPEPARDLPPIEPLTQSQLDEMGPSARWKHVVETLRQRSSPIAAAAEHAYVERFDDGTIELSFADKYLDFISEGGRLDKLRDVVSALFGDRWKVVVATRDHASGVSTKTLAEEREEERNRRRKNLEVELRESDVVKQVKEVFEVPEDDVRVQVALFDDPT